VKRVLVSRLDANGDVLLAGPAVRAVAAAGAHVTLVAGPRGIDAARLLPGVDDLKVFRADWIDPRPGRVRQDVVVAFANEVRRSGVEEALILGSLRQSPLPLALLLRMAGVQRIGAICEDYPGSLLDVRHRPAEGLHEVERNLAVARACGFELPDDDDDALRIQLRGERDVDLPFDEPYVVVHPGASVPARAWGAERNAELVEVLRRRGWNVAVTGSPDERNLCRYVAGPRHHRVRNVAGTKSFAQLAQIVTGAQAIVVGNTGPAHLAAAVGTPVVSIFAPAAPLERWHPWKVRHEVLNHDVSCAACRARACRVPGHASIASIDVRAAVEALDRVVAQAVPV